MRLSWRLWGWILARRRDVEKEEAVVLVSIGRTIKMLRYVPWLTLIRVANPQLQIIYYVSGNLAPPLE